MSTPGPFRAAPSPVTPPPLPAAVVVFSATSLTPLEQAIETAGAERQAANGNLWQLQRHITEPPKRFAARTRFVQNLASDYLPAIQALRDAGTPDELRAALAGIDARLERGWGVTGERADELWVRLLAQHEALVDALSDNALASMLDRLDVWGKRNTTGLSQQPAQHALTGERVAIVGSREFAELDRVRAYVDGLPANTLIISGGARGVDTAAAHAARARGLPDPLEFLPDTKLGDGRFHARNRQIVDACDRLIAFWDGTSPGTNYTVGYARQQGKPVEVIQP